MEHSYKAWHKALSKELCEYMDCFVEKQSKEAFCMAKDLIKTIKNLYEIEAYEIMFDCLEDHFGYDREDHEFEDKDGGMEYVLLHIQNAYNPTRMTGGTSRYPTTTGYGYGTGADRRYGEHSTDRSMYPGWMNMVDGRGSNGGSRGGNGSRTGGMSGRNGSYQNHYMPYDHPYDEDWDEDDDYYGERKFMNAGRGGRGGNQRRDSRGRYTRRIYNMADDHDVKKSLKALTPKEMEQWVKDLESEDGRTGEIFSKSEIESIARKHNINFEDEDYDLNTLWLMANVMYSDYAQVISKMPNGNQPINYVKLAIAFLDDPDVDLEPEMKVAKYYRSIVEDKDD